MLNSHPRDKFRAAPKLIEGPQNPIESARSSEKKERKRSPARAAERRNARRDSFIVYTFAASVLRSRFTAQPSPAHRPTRRIGAPVRGWRGGGGRDRRPPIAAPMVAIVASATPRERLAGLVGSAKSSPDVPSKLGRLRDLKEDLLQDDPVLLAEFLPQLLDLLSDRCSPVRKFVTQ